jgi:anti-sigma B factor antagonist
MTGAVFTMQLEDTSDGAPNVATVSGKIDVTNTEDFTQSIKALAGARPLIVDLSSLRYLDSAGFAALDRLLIECNVAIVIAPGSLVQRAAVVMELPFHHDTDSALQAEASEG